MKATVAVFLAAVFCAGAFVAANEEQVSLETTVLFQRDIAPILKSECFECHGVKKPEGQLRLITRSAAIRGGFSGASIVPGQPDESPLYQRITSADPELRMPFEVNPLPREKIELIRKWIEQGAHWPESDASRLQVDEQHWAYIKPIRPQPPAVANSGWIRNPIDAFVLARLEKEGLAPSPEASKEQVLRRLTLDLIGLPPTLAEVDAFLADTAPEAYEKVVDRLLASPQYGERWAQPWLDAARYADSNGFTNDRQRTIWPYRDWVINAINSDMPFDQFTIEQIAGDLLPNTTVPQRIATGFHRNTMFNDEQGVDQGEARWNAMVDRVGTTATVWLATTLACAQCHNHKYDPFSQKDFYGLLAFFENTDFTMVGESYDRKYMEPVLDVASPDIQEQRQSLELQIAKLEKEIDGTANSGENNQEVGSQAANRQRLSALKEEADKLSKQYPKTMVMQERPTEAPLTTFLRVKGSYLTKGDAIPAGMPAALHPVQSDAPLNRFALARWLVDEENPLSARVTVNRYWSQFFGRGLVETEEDFGTRGAFPSHPELLDWLATEFIRAGWSAKKIHKTIAMSATYRQSSHVTRELLERDPDNRLLARGPRFRMSAEMIRDATLAISGILSLKIGGPSVFPPQPELSSLKDHGDYVWVESKGEDRYRRGIYTFWRRSALYPALMNFDAPSRESCTVKRLRSNTPLQALTLLNDVTAYEAALALAKRIRAEAESDDLKDRVTYAFRLCTARKPSTEELEVLVRSHRAVLTLMGQDSGAVQRIAASAKEPVADPDFAAWFLMSQALLNLDETLSKE